MEVTFGLLFIILSPIIGAALILGNILERVMYLGSYMAATIHMTQCHKYVRKPEHEACARFDGSFWAAMAMKYLTTC